MEKKAEVQKLVKSNSDRISYTKNMGRSEVWNFFKLIIVDGKEVPFVLCSRCKTVLAWRSRDGTNGLWAHKDYCINRMPATKITAISAFSLSNNTNKVPMNIKSEVADIVVAMCATDVRPFSVVDGDGFRNLASKLISIGAKYGNVDLDQVMPCGSTVSCHLDGIVDKEKIALVNKLAVVSQLGVTIDLWRYNQRNYISVTVQYIDNWQIESYILATRLLDENHTSENIKLTVKSILDEFSAQRHGNVFITESANNMKAAFREYMWIECSCHNLNLVLSHGLQHTNLDDTGLPPEVAKLIDTVKELVTLAKRTKINNHLVTTLKQCVITQWNSVLLTLKSMVTNFTDIHTLSAEPEFNTNFLRLLADIKEDLLADVIQVLEPVDMATKCLSTYKSPSLHLVLPTKIKLQKQFTQKDSDSSIILQLKTHLLNMLNRYFIVQQLHCTAALLDPRFKTNFETLAPTEYAQALSNLKEMVDRLPAAETSDDSSALQQPNKKMKLEENFLGDLYSSSSNISEVDAYLTTTDEITDDILSYWKEKSTKWKNLSEVARRVLGVPAASTSSEQSFSLSGHVLEDRLSQLEPHTADGLLFLHGLKK